MGAAWLSWTTLGAFALATLFAGFAYYELPRVKNAFDRLAPNGSGDFLILYPFSGCATISAGCSLVLASGAIAWWIGWVNLAIGVTTVAAVLFVLDTLIRRRKRAIANPFRALLALDERVMRSRSTVIAEP